MTVDAHLHLWDLAARDYSWNTPELGPVHASFDAADAWAALAAGGVDGAVLVQAADTDGDTDALLGVARSADWARGVVAWVPLEDPDGARARLAGWRDSAAPVVGVRQLIHDDPRSDLLDRPAVRSSLREVAILRLPFDVPDAWPRLWPALTRLVDELPELTVVLDHLGKPDLADAAAETRERWLDDLADLARRPNVVAKVSGLGGLRPRASGRDEGEALVRAAVDRALEAFGPDRLLFGGDWPVSLGHSAYGETVGVARRALQALSPVEQAQVFGGVATRVYDLDAVAGFGGIGDVTPATDGASSPRR